MRALRGASICLVLSVLGLGLAAYLVVPHLGLMRGEILGGAICTGVGPFNCHVVTGSTWGSFLGIPLALWGVVGYVALLALALLARVSADWSERALTAIVLLASLCVAVDLALLTIMALVIRSFCLLCLLTYAVNLSLVVVASRALGRPWLETLRKGPAAWAGLVPSSERPAAWLFWGMLFVGWLGSMGVHAATTYVGRGSLAGQREQMRQYVSQQPQVFVDVAGDPVIGRPGASIRIVEFSDLRCPVCQRASKLNPIILASHRAEAAFVFKHYPLDTACNDGLNHQVHPRACELAAATECAHRQGKFWALHDRIFERGKDYPVAQVGRDVLELGLDVSRFNACMSSGEGLEAVKRDIAEAERLGVTSTPTYVINGIKVSGIITPSAFEELLALIRERNR